MNKTHIYPSVPNGRPLVRRIYVPAYLSTEGLDLELDNPNIGPSTHLFVSTRVQIVGRFRVIREVDDVNNDSYGTIYGI
jgi:hypothetical protein